MGCCGKAKNIVRGFGNLAVDKISGQNKYEFTDARVKVCLECAERTWLTWKEFAKAVIGKLPKQEYIEGRRLFCKECNCFIPAKARVPDEKCSLNKWES